MQKEISKYKSPDSLEVCKYKPMLLNWITERFNLSPYKHTFQDTYFGLHIWDGKLSISIDKRIEAQINLLNSVPKEYVGCNQYKTGIRVNLDSIYFDIEKEFSVIYPEIVSSRIVHTEKQYDDGDTWNSYTHEVLLNDNTILITTDNDEVLKMKDFYFKTLIQQRTIYNYLILNFDKK